MDITPQTANPTSERPARPGETCSCGRPAATVYLTTDHGDVPYCGEPSRPAEANTSRPATLRHRARMAAAQMFALGPDPKRNALASMPACITGLGDPAGTDDASPAVWSDVVPPGGEVCAVPMPAMPGGICGMPVESEPCPEHAQPELLVCQKHLAEAAEFDMFADLPPWEELPGLIQDGPPCPNCGTEVTRWDAISPDYPGDWWTCRNDHRFLLDHDGRTWRET